MTWSCESGLKIRHTNLASLRHINTLENSNDDLSAEVAQGAFDSINELRVAHFTISIPVESLEESSDISFGDIDTVTINRLGKLVLIKRLWLVRIHHFKGALEADQATVAFHEQFIPEFLN